MSMSYGHANHIKQKSVLSLVTKRFVQGQGIGTAIGGALADKTSAKFTRMKERLDPMSWSRKIGGKLGAGIYGRMMGRSAEDMYHFTGVKPKSRIRDNKIPTSKSKNPNINPLYTKISSTSVTPIRKNDSVSDILSKIYNYMKIGHEKDIKLRELEHNKKKGLLDDADRKYKDLLKSLGAGMGNHGLGAPGGGDDGDSPLEILAKLLGGMWAGKKLLSWLRKPKTIAEKLGDKQPISPKIAGKGKGKGKGKLPPLRKNQSTKNRIVGRGRAHYLQDRRNRLKNANSKLKLNKIKAANNENFNQSKSKLAAASKSAKDPKNADTFKNATARKVTKAEMSRLQRLKLAESLAKKQDSLTAFKKLQEQGEYKHRTFAGAANSKVEEVLKNKKAAKIAKVEANRQYNRRGGLPLSIAQKGLFLTYIFQVWKTIESLNPLEFGTKIEFNKAIAEIIFEAVIDYGIVLIASSIGGLVVGAAAGAATGGIGAVPGLLAGLVAGATAGSIVDGSPKAKKIEAELVDHIVNFFYDGAALKYAHTEREIILEFGRGPTGEQVIMGKYGIGYNDEKGLFHKFDDSEVKALREQAKQISNDDKNKNGWINSISEFVQPIEDKVSEYYNSGVDTIKGKLQKLAVGDYDEVIKSTVYNALSDIVSLANNAKLQSIHIEKGSALSNAMDEYNRNSSNGAPSVIHLPNAPTVGATIAGGAKNPPPNGQIQDVRNDQMRKYQPENPTH